MAGLERLQLPTVRGNHDRWFAEAERSGLAASDAFAFDRLTAAEIAASAACRRASSSVPRASPCMGARAATSNTCSRTSATAGFRQPIPRACGSGWAK